MISNELDQDFPPQKNTICESVKMLYKSIQAFGCCQGHTNTCKQTFLLVKLSLSTKILFAHPNRWSFFLDFVFSIAYILVNSIPF